MPDRRWIDTQAEYESARGLRATIEAVPIGIAQLTPSGDFLWANTSFLELLEYSLAELMARPLRKVTVAEDARELEAPIARVVSGETSSFRGSVRFIRRSGSSVGARVSLSGMRDASGEVAFVVLTVETIVEVPVSEAARLRALLEASPLGIVVMDLEGHPTFYNPKAEDLHGLSLERARGTAWAEAVHPDDRDRVAGSWREAASQGRPWADTYRFLHPDGTVVWVSGRAAPIYVKGEMVGYVGTLDDITPLKLAEQALRESEARFRTIVDGIPEIVWMTDSRGVVTLANKRWYDYTGLTPEELRDEGWVKALHPRHADRVRRGIRRALREEEPWEDTFPIRSGAGTYRWFLSRLVPIRDPGEDVLRWYGTSTDITERTEAAAERERLLQRERSARGEAERRAVEEEALREGVAAVAATSTTREIIRTIAESALAATSAAGALVERLTADGAEIVIVAAAGETLPLTGSRTSYEGSLAQRVIERAKPEVVRRLADSRLRLSGRLVGGHPDHSAIGVPLVGATEGKAIGALILLRRPEDPRFHEDEIRRARTFADLATLEFRKVQLLETSERKRRELERVMESRALLMRGFSHDVKNPLGAADGFLALLEQGIGGDLSSKQCDNVRRARRALGDSLGLIEDLLDLARTEAGQIEMEWMPLDVRDVVREIAETSRAQAEAKGLEMRIDLPADLPIIETDANRVRQILLNLFSNAIKYTDEGSVRATVELRSGHDAISEGTWITTTVRDTGPGIAPDKQAAIFEEFVRLNPDEKAGAGLGLAISRRLARALGGEISLESRPKRGSAFTLWLPCSRGAAPALGEEKDARTAA